MKKILVIRFSSLGDVILTTAIFSNLKRQWPQAEIAALTKSAMVPVYEGNPDIDRVIAFDPSREKFSDLSKAVRYEKFDMIVDLQGNPRSWFLRVVAGPPLALVVDKATLPRWGLVHFKKFTDPLKRSVRERILECLARIDVPVVNSETRLFPSGVESVFAKHGLPLDRLLIGIAPGAKHATKRWLPGRFAETAGHMAKEKNALVVLVGDRHDQSAGREAEESLDAPFVNLVGQTSLSELIAVVSRFSFLLTNDSGLLHMGEALKIPLVAIFGPTVRGFGFAPFRKTSRMVEIPDLRCRPCSLHGEERCPLGHHLCMRDIETGAVMAAVSSILE